MFSEIIEPYLKALRSFDEKGLPILPSNAKHKTHLESIEKFLTAFAQQYYGRDRLPMFSVSNSFVMRILYGGGCSNGYTYSSYVYSIIFSNYGHLVTIKGDLREYSKDHAMEIYICDIAKLLEEYGFTYIPYEIACLPYDGRYKEDFKKLYLKTEYLWLDRYFGHRFD